MIDKIEQLPITPANREVVGDVINEAFTQWRDNPGDTNNSIVILSSPVTSVSKILTETLEEWAKEQQISLKVFPLASRPDEITTIKTQLETYFAPKSDDLDSEVEAGEIAIIPNLNWCFLRSLDGLEGIEYLQDLLCHGSSDRFWIIGAGQVGWEYLNSICPVEAYCGKIVTLSETTPEELSEWLEPIAKDLDIVFEEPRLDKKLLDGEKNDRANYFARLADISGGVGTVAVQGFLKSIAYEPIEKRKDKAEGKKEKEFILIAQSPKLPKLPNLNNSEQYLLYSLLLHGDLTLSTLAESLADEEAEVRAIVRILRRKGVIEQRNGVLKINPIHYPKLKYELAINNFIVNHES